MDVIIPFMIGQTDDLRYALRSLQKWGPQVDNLYIVGEKIPKWCTNAIHVIHPDCYDDQWKEKNQADKVLKVLSDYKTSEYFLYMHDDHFATNHIRDVHWYDNTIYAKIQLAHEDGIYRKTMVNTINLIGYGARNYDVHAPMVIHTPLFLQTVGKLDWGKRYGYCIKSIYADKVEVGNLCTDFKDLKIRYPETRKEYAELIKGREWFSNDDLAWDDFGEMKLFLEELYPNKSKWEK